MKHSLVKSVLFAAFVLVATAFAPAAASALKFQLPASGVLTSETDPVQAFNRTAVGDFNGDGIEDVAATSTANGNFVFLANGDGTFNEAEGSPFAQETPSARINAGDFNDDGYDDLLVSTLNYPYTFRTYLSDEGSFEDDTPAGSFVIEGVADYVSVSVGQLNDDSNPDIVVGQLNHSFTVALGDGNGAFALTGASPINIPVPTGGGTADDAKSTAIGDYDGDGDNDVALGLRNAGSFVDADNGLYVALNDGDANFTPEPNNPILQKDGIEQITSGRFDEDVNDDLVMTIRDGVDNLRIYLGATTNVLVPSPSPTGKITIQPPFSHTLSVGNFDDDAGDDVVVNGSDAISVALGDLDGGLSLAPGSASMFWLPQAGGKNGFPRQLLAGDFNDDGLDDISAFSGNANDDSEARGIYPLINAADLQGPESITFSDAPVDEETTKIVEITNLGAAPAEYANEGLSFTGPDADEFTVTVASEEAECEEGIPAGGTCEIEISFEPLTTGEKDVNLQIELGGEGPAQIVNFPIFANAVAAPESQIVLTPVGHDFGEAVIGATGTRPSFTFTVNSVGTGPAEITAVSAVATDNHPRSFAVTENGCAGLFQPGTFCTVTVTFNPVDGEPVKRLGKLVVDTATESVEAALSGTATKKPVPPPPPPGKAALSLKLKSPGKVKRGKTLVVKATVTNTGDAAATSILLKPSVPKKLAKKPKAIRVSSLAAGQSVTKKIKVKVKKSAKKGKKLKVKVVASATGVSKKSAKRTVKVR